MNVPKMMTWTETSLQRTEQGISVDPKKFTREKTEMVSRLDLCWQSSCVYHLWIPEEKNNRLMQKNCWLAQSSERRTQRKWLKVLERCVGGRMDFVIKIQWAYCHMSLTSFHLYTEDILKTNSMTLINLKWTVPICIQIFLWEKELI